MTTELTNLLRDCSDQVCEDNICATGWVLHHLVPTKEEQLKQRPQTLLMYLRRPIVPEVRLTDQEIADLHNGLDVLRQVYAEPE